MWKLAPRRGPTARVSKDLVSSGERGLESVRQTMCCITLSSSPSPQCSAGSDVMSNLRVRVRLFYGWPSTACWTAARTRPYSRREWQAGPDR
ncbi:hypothetical protein LshimejAT787_0504220 [Lyophyllum shimeji]|uniref:Uncharacterized protein n=1 Tax=Lyophyllum shimeji TaxID=47721 RepID=A0A9P3PLJ8_LYOSH|nr:hypothetical protein LshimejAT787_0504220 [Lyophyllum shimeji]